MTGSLAHSSDHDISEPGGKDPSVTPKPSNHVTGVKAAAVTMPDDLRQSPARGGLTASTGKVRKRVKQGCDSCRRFKRRCSGERPACTACLRRKQSCTYAGGRPTKGETRGHVDVSDTCRKLGEARSPLEYQGLDLGGIRCGADPPASPGPAPDNGDRSPKSSADELFAQRFGGRRIPGEQLSLEHGEQDKTFVEGSEPLLPLPPPGFQEDRAGMVFDWVYDRSYLPHNSGSGPTIEIPVDRDGTRIGAVACREAETTAVTSGGRCLDFQGQLRPEERSTQDDIPPITQDGTGLDYSGALPLDAFDLTSPDPSFSGSHQFPRFLFRGGCNFPAHVCTISFWCIRWQKSSSNFNSI